MTDKETIGASKFLSLVLRHEPERVGLKLGDMHRAGFVFRCSANGVWLVNRVPPESIQFPDQRVSVNSANPSDNSLIH